MDTDKLTVFLHYTQRYETISRHFPLQARQTQPPSRTDAMQVEAELRRDQDYQHALHTYFNMCSEQHYLRQATLIDNDVWEMWKEGMRSAMQNPHLTNAWNERRDGYKHLTDFQAMMDNFVLES